jgi:hypothetical protein
MRTRWLRLALVLLGSHTWAQVGDDKTIAALTELLTH